MKKKLMELQGAIGYHFHDVTLLEHALSHSSYANEKRLGRAGSNERLEFLGDAVLELVSSEFFFKLYADKPEGDLTKIRASFVCEPALAYCAEQFHLGEYLLLGKGEEATGGRSRASIVSDAFEALIGGIYLDGGFASAKEVIDRFILSDIEGKQFFYDSKTILQEIVQKDSCSTLEYKLLEGQSVEYVLISEHGPDHQKIFTVAVFVDEKEYARASGTSKKNAEQLAAYETLKILGKVNVSKKD